MNWIFFLSVLSINVEWAHRCIHGTMRYTYVLALKRNDGNDKEHFMFAIPNILQSNDDYNIPEVPFKLPNQPKMMATTLLMNERKNWRKEEKAKNTYYCVLVNIIHTLIQVITTLSAVCGVSIDEQLIGIL